MTANKNKNNKAESAKSSSSLIKNLCSRKVLDMLDQKILELEKKEQMREKSEKKKETERRARPAERPSQSAPARPASQPPKRRKRVPLKGILRKSDLPDNSNNARAVDYYTYTSPAPSRQLPYQEIRGSHIHNSVPEAWGAPGSRSPQVRFQGTGQHGFYGVPFGNNPYGDIYGRSPYNSESYVGNHYNSDPYKVDDRRQRPGGRQGVETLLTKYGAGYSQNSQNPVKFSKKPRPGPPYQQGYRSNMNANRQKEAPKCGRKPAKAKSPAVRPPTERKNESQPKTWRDVTHDTQDMIARYDAMFESQRLSAAGRRDSTGDRWRPQSDYEGCSSATESLSRNNNKYSPGTVSDSGFDYKVNYEKLDKLLSGPQTIENLIHKYTSSTPSSYTTWRKEPALSGGYGSTNFYSTALKREFSNNGYSGLAGYTSTYTPSYSSNYTSNYTPNYTSNYTPSYASNFNAGVSSFSKSSSSLLASCSNMNNDGTDPCSRRGPYVAASPIVKKSCNVGTNNSNATMNAHRQAAVTPLDTTPSFDAFRTSSGEEDKSTTFERGVGPQSSYYQSRFMTELMRDVRPSPSVTQSPSRSSSSESAAGPRGVKTYAELMAAYKVSSPDPSPCSTASPRPAHAKFAASDDDLLTLSMEDDDEDDNTLLEDEDDDNDEEEEGDEEDGGLDEEEEDAYAQNETYTFMNREDTKCSGVLSDGGPWKGRDHEISDMKNQKANSDSNKIKRSYTDVTDLAQDLIDLANGNINSFNNGEVTTEHGVHGRSRDSYASFDESESFRPAKKPSIGVENGRRKPDLEEENRVGDKASSRVKHIDSLLNNLSKLEM